MGCAAARSGSLCGLDAPLVPLFNVEATEAQFAADTRRWRSFSAVAQAVDRRGGHAQQGCELGDR
jgi:hypothetical protein